VIAEREVLTNVVVRMAEGEAALLLVAIDGCEPTGQTAQSMASLREFSRALREGLRFSDPDAVKMPPPAKKLAVKRKAPR